MNIVTKYDIGDKVWIVTQKKVKENCPTCHRKTESQIDRWVAIEAAHIDAIFVYVDQRRAKTGDMDIRYHAGLYHGYEKDFFLTREAAELEAALRNDPQVGLLEVTP